MTNNVALALDKLLFCRRITADISSFFRLVIASKSFSRSRVRDIPNQRSDEYLVNIGGKKKTMVLRRFSGDLDIFYEVFWKHTYAVTQLHSRQVSTVLDLGANTGMSSAYFYSCFPHAEFYCVEPDPANMELLKHNLRGLIPDHKIHLLQAAVGASDSRGDLVAARYAYNSRVAAGKADGDINVLSMDSVLSSFGLEQVSLVKMDIEGAESEALSDMGWLRNVQFIFIEFHDERTLKNGIAKLESAGFRWKICVGNKMLVYAENTIF